MTVVIPTVPPYYTAPQLEDDIAQQIQLRFVSKLAWLQNAYHIVKTGVHANEKYTYPLLYANDGTKKYFDIRPDDRVASYSFFEIEKPTTIDSESREYTAHLSIVFWANLERVDPSKDYDFTGELVKDVINVLEYFDAANVTEDRRFERIFDKYTGLKQEDNKQHLMQRNTGFKITFEVTGSLTDTCDPQAINSCQLNIDRINALPADVKACVIAALGGGGSVTIVDQDGNEIDTVDCGDEYQVLVFSEIYDDTPNNEPVDEIFDDVFNT
jgi:hypothetical protein